MTTMNWKNILLDLTPAAAFKIFGVALAVSAGSLFTDIGRPWLVVAPVAVYGGLLWFAQRRFFVALNGTLKDSPYFLGFILTLIALVQIFWSIAGNADSLAADPGPLVRALAEALTTTVLGLLFRQALHSLDPGDAARDAAFQTLVTSIRQNAADFYQAQQQLVVLVKEFTTAREAMFASEQGAHTRYVQSLSTAATQLADLQRSWPEQLGKLQNTLESTGERFTAATKDYAGMISSARADLDQSVARAGEIIGEAATEGADGLRAAEDTIRARLDSISAALKLSGGALSEEVAVMRTTIAAYPAEAKTLSEALAATRTEIVSLGTHAASAASNMDAVSKALQSAHEDASRFGKEALATANEVINEGARITEELNNRARGLLGELQATDEIIEEVLGLLESRVKLLGTTGTYAPPGDGVRSR